MTSVNSAVNATFDVYPSAFQLIERPLYYLNKEWDHGNVNLSTALGSTKLMIISYLAWPIIMCAAPFTALIDIGMGIGEAFYAKYKNATSDQIILIIQKKVIASPLQHLVYITTNLALPFFISTVYVLSERPFPLRSIMPEIYFFTALLAPALALFSYYLTQKIIDSQLPTWACPEGFSIFINRALVSHEKKRTTGVHSTVNATFDVYPSAFQLVEKPLYYLNKESNNHHIYTNLELSRFMDNLKFAKLMIISYLAWPIIMCAAPFTALIDIGMGIGEAFYAKYKNATSDQITLIIQKKVIASPLQHLVYITTNLALPFFAGAVTAVSASVLSNHVSNDGLSQYTLTTKICFLSALLAPALALFNYQLTQQIIGRQLPAWARPEGFSIFINGGSLGSPKQVVII